MTSTRLRDSFPIPLALFGFSLGLRLVWTWNTHGPTLDTAVVGLMAMDIQEGARPLFFTGQGYMGALEAYLTAGVFEAFGADRFTMTIVPSVFGALWPVVLYAVLRVGLPTSGALAGAAVAAFPSAQVLWYTSVPYGGYPEMYVFGTALILHALVRTAQDRVRPWRDAAGFSLLLFLGVWTNLQVFPFLAAASCLWLRLLWFRRRHPRVWLPFALAPLAMAAALLPQILLSAENPASPPLFSAATSRQALNSFRALWAHDVEALTGWPRSGFPSVYALGTHLPLWIFGAAALVARRPGRMPRPLLATSGLFLAFFALVYFPHPMSGYVPRYLIAPFVWITALAAGLVWAVPSRRFRVVGGVAFGFWLAGQAAHFPDALRHRRAKLDDKMEELRTVVAVARDQNLEALRFIGSGMEGHRAAAFTFEAGGDPLFVSSYDERRRAADLTWHLSDRAGYFFTEHYEPFVRGSLKEMGIPNPKIVPAGRFRVMPTPPDPGAPGRWIPTRPDAWTSTPSGAERLADGPAEPWPDTTRDARVRMTLDVPRRVSGMRLVALPGHSLPYRYTVTGGRAGETGTVLAECERRLGSSHVSGGRVYFKGYARVLDARWSPREVDWVELHVRPGPLNKLPLRLAAVDLWSADPEGENRETAWPELRAWVADVPKAKVVASDGVATGILRGDAAGRDFWAKRLTPPWNPRDPASRNPYRPLKLDQGVLFVVPTGAAPRLRIRLAAEGIAFSHASFGALTGVRIPEARPDAELQWCVDRLSSHPHLFSF